MGSYSPVPEPQILPPVNGYQSEPPPIRKQRSMWAVAPATYILVAINCLVFLAMVARHVSAMDPTPDQLMIFGADNAGAEIGRAHV